MRTLNTSPSLSLHAVAGTHVVALGIDMPEQMAGGLLGFSIWRREQPEGEWRALEGLKYFKGVKAGGGEGAAGSTTSTEFHPIQDFFWSDFTVRPGREYEYRVVAQAGRPGQLQPIAELSAKVKTESNDHKQKHAVYFNRGVSGSQAFVRKFGSGPFEQIAAEKPWVWEWLSRGLVEGLRDFIRTATGSGWAIRGAVYEFEYEPVLTELAQAARRGADVQVVWAAMTDSESAQKVTEDNREAIERVFAGSTATLMPRTQSGDIPHNKF
ncbi:MAG TPA: hypothetical protein PKD78_10050, partial [Saprospiraceae bacterium]|nr:hypothetical protein [Saprospiraceae bacterium]